MTTSSVGHEDLIETIDSIEFPSFSQPKMSIEIPTSLVRMCSNMSGIVSNCVHLVSFLYANVTELLPSGLPGDNRYFFSRIIMYYVFNYTQDVLAHY